MSVRIIGTGSYLPKKVADNNFLSTIVDTDDEWIRQRTGIKERHLSNGKEGTTYMAAHAAEAALENAGIGADELDMIIVATVSADTYVPSTSCSVQGAIGAIRATCFDINAACSGFLFALNTAYAYIEMGMAKTVLVAGAETLSREVDWSDRGSCILFGDGSGAAIVQKDDSNVGGLIASVTGSDGTQGDVLTCKGRGIQNPFHNSKRKKDYIRMDGQAVFRFAVTMVPRCVKQILKKTETDVDDIKFFVLHQANVRILELIANFIHRISGGNVTFIIIIIIWVSAIASAFIDNIPFAATMIPVIDSLAAAQGVDISILAWALAMGTDIGGSATPIGASANVVGIATAAKSGHMIKWGKYCKAMAPATILVVLVSMLMIYARYL